MTVPCIPNEHPHAGPLLEPLLQKVLWAGADAVALDLEDAVPPQAKIMARSLVAEVLGARGAWVRVNAAGGAESAMGPEIGRRHRVYAQL